MVPVSGDVVRRFDRPSCERCPGHRGITVASSPGEPVVAVAAGTVEFVGEVGGRTYVVQRVAPSVVVTYGGVTPTVRDGATVQRGEQVATADGETYLSVREAGRHLEPLRALGLGRARLVGPGDVGPSAPSR